MRAGIACALATIAFVGACGGGHGLHLVIDANGTGATTVALYVGNAPCTKLDGNPCQSIAPRDFTDRVQGTIWLRDNGMSSATVSRGVVDFRVESPADATVQLIAVGFDANGPVGVAMLSDVKLPGGQLVDASAKLSAAQQLTESLDMMRMSGNYVKTWSSDSPLSLSDCVGVEQITSNGSTPSRVFIVPKGDEDCDGHLDGNSDECDVLWYDAPGLYSSLSSANCATLVPFEYTGLHTCLLGGGTCSDGSGFVKNACKQTDEHFCMANAICQPPATVNARCDAMGWTNLGLSCLDSYELAGVIEAFQCTVHVPSSTNVCATGTQTTSIDFAPFLGSHTCSGVEWTTDSLVGLMAQSTLPPPLAATFTVAQPMPAPGTPCTLGITLTGPASPPSSQGTWVFADVDIDNGNHALVPVHFSVVPCTATEPIGFACELLTDPNFASDGITHCAM